MFLRLILANNTKFAVKLLKFFESPIDFMEKYSNFAVKKSESHRPTR